MMERVTYLVHLGLRNWCAMIHISLILHVYYPALSGIKRDSLEPELPIT